MLLRDRTRQAEADPPFTLGWLFSMMMKEKKSPARSADRLPRAQLPDHRAAADRDVDHRQGHHASQLLDAVPDERDPRRSWCCIETLLGFARRLIIAVVGVRTDAKLNLHVFDRLIRLPLDYFERHPAGETMYKVSQIHQVRQFITGKLMTTLLDMITLAVLLPFLFWLNATLAWIVLVCATMHHADHPGLSASDARGLRQGDRRRKREKQSALGETIFGIKTVKSLALEPQRKALWDERVAEVGKWRLGIQQAVQLAADPGDADRAVHVDGHHPGRRLSRADR